MDVSLASLGQVVLPVPSFENKAHPVSWIRDGDFLVVEHCVGCVKPDRVVERALLNVAIPHDEGSLRGGGLKVRTQAERVGGTVRGNLLTSGSHEIHDERTSGIGEGAVHIFALRGIPTLDNPVGEDTVRRRGRGAGHRYHPGFVKVAVGVHRQGTRHTTGAHILHYRAFRTVELVPPLCVEVQFLGDPEPVAAVKADNVAVVGRSIRAIRVS